MSKRKLPSQNWTMSRPTCLALSCVAVDVLLVHCMCCCSCTRRQACLTLRYMQTGSSNLWTLEQCTHLMTQVCCSVEPTHKQLFGAAIKALSTKLRSDSQFCAMSNSTSLFDATNGTLHAALCDMMGEEHLMILTIQRMREIFSQNVNVGCSWCSATGL
jgi:hypothetical protein